MPSARPQKLSLLDVFFTLMVDPRGITKQLFARDKQPPWVITTLCLFMSTCVLAPLVYTPNRNMPAPTINQLAPSVLSTLLTLGGTSFFLLMVLHSLNVRRVAYRTFSSIIYATAPFVTTLAALLIANKLLYGDLSLLGIFGFGTAPGSNITLTIFPITMRLAAVLSFVILSQSLRTITNSSRSVGILLALSTLPLLLGSFVVSVTVTDLIFPGSSSATISFFSTYTSGPSLTQN